jgi:hypothetical protein
MWGRTLALIIIFILAFGVLIAWIPDSFAPDYTIQDSEAVSAISAANLIIYANQGADNMTHGYDSYDDGPSAPDWNVSGLADGEYILVKWLQAPFGGWYVSLTHVGTNWLGFKTTIDLLEFSYTDGSLVDNGGFPFQTGITKSNLETAWSSTSNSSAFTAKCDHVTVSIVFKPDEGYDDIGESFDDGYLWYAISYEWNAEDTGFNVMSLVIKLLSFQGIGLGVPGPFGAFLDALLSAFFYLAIIIVAYVVITAVIPFISGVPDS